MRALVQRAASGWVLVEQPGPDGKRTWVETGRIGRGLVVLLGVTHDDEVACAERMAQKLWNLRVFADESGVMNQSCAEVGGDLLVVSQFTLYGDTRKGRRPSYVAAAASEQAEPLVEAVVEHLRAMGGVVATGRFGAMMQVGIVNDGPVTLWVEL